MIDMAEVIEFLEALHHGVNRYMVLKKQLEIPNMTSEDTVGIIAEMERVGKRIVELVVTGMME